MPAARLYMDATITANRSLSPRGFALLMAVVVGLDLLIAAYLRAIGAVPVPLFLLGGATGLYGAFRVLFRRQAGFSERVQVSAEAVSVRWESPRGSRELWRSPTAFTRMSVETGERTTTRVRLGLRERRVFVGQALSPGEREAFGRALERAVAEARAERWETA